MKKILMAAALFAFIGQPAFAKGDKKNQKDQQPCYFNTCTDHSLDEAYSARWADQAQSPAPGAKVYSAAQSGKSAYAGYRTTYYSFPGQELPNVTVRDTRKSGYVRPSAYMGDDAPSYDGAATNAYRNMNVANTVDPIPPSTGDVQ